MSVKLANAVAGIARPVLEELGLRLWDVEFVKEGGENYLRIFIDKEGGVAIEDCEAVSRAMDAPLEKADPIQASYIFEVSSAGLERTLRTPEHFSEFIGHQVCLRTYAPHNGSREFIGALSGYANGDVTIEIDGEAKTFMQKEIAVVRLHAVF